MLYALHGNATTKEQPSSKVQDIVKNFCNKNK